MDPDEAEGTQRDGHNFETMFLIDIYGHCYFIIFLSDIKRKFLYRKFSNKFPPRSSFAIAMLKQQNSEIEMKGKDNVDEWNGNPFVCEILRNYNLFERAEKNDAIYLSWMMLSWEIFAGDSQRLMNEQRNKKWNEIHFVKGSWQASQIYSEHFWRLWRHAESAHATKQKWNKNICCSTVCSMFVTFTLLHTRTSHVLRFALFTVRFVLPFNPPVLRFSCSASLHSGSYVCLPINGIVFNSLHFHFQPEWLAESRCQVHGRQSTNATITHYNSSNCVPVLVIAAQCSYTLNEYLRQTNAQTFGLCIYEEYWRSFRL